MQPDDTIQQRVRAAFGRDVIAWAPVTTGYTAAARWRVRLEDGTCAFIKAGTNENTSQWLRAEHYVYEHIGVDAPFMARVLAWHDDGDALLALEDLGDAHWPPPWTDTQVARVRHTLDAIHDITPPPALPVMGALRNLWHGWHRIGEDPEPFLSLGVASEAWLTRALPTLQQAEDAVELEGDALCHLDVRSDNICIHGGERVVFVDWNWACRGNPDVDSAFWLPSLALEGGPRPEAVFPHAPELAALVSGYFAVHAGLHPGGLGPVVRSLQKRQLGVALPWAVRALELPHPA